VRNLLLPFGRYIVWTSLYDLNRLAHNLERGSAPGPDVADLAETLAAIFDDWVPSAAAAAGRVLYPGEVEAFVALEQADYDHTMLRAPLDKCEQYLRSPEMRAFFSRVSACLNVMGRHGLPPFDEHGKPIPIESIWDQ